MIYSKYPAEEIISELNFHFPGAPKNLYSKETRILDIGCGTGRFLHILKELGFKNLLGIDPYYSHDIIYPNGLRILKKSIHDINGKFDLIMFHHSFEHVPNPIDILQSVSKLLSKNGFCLIRMPLVDSYAWAHYRHNWAQLDAPRHFFLHSTKSMSVLSNKTRLHIKKIVYDSTEFQFWGSEQYIKDIPLQSDGSYFLDIHKSIFTQEEIDVFKKKAEELNHKNQGSQAAFYLTEPSGCFSTRGAHPEARRAEGSHGDPSSLCSSG